MLGLIIKDLLYIKSLWKNLLIIFACSVLISVSFDNYIFAICIIPLSLITMGINTFQADEFFNTDIYTLSYPIKRSNIVLAKYLYTLILFVISSIIGIVLFLIFRIFNSSIGIDVLVYLFIFLLIAVLIDMIFYPIIYKYGCEKSSFILTTIIVVILSIVSIIRVILINLGITIEIDYTSVIEFITVYGLYILVIGSIVVSLLSYQISKKIFDKLDFQ